MLQLILIAAALAALFYYFAIKPMTYWQERGVKQTKKTWLFGDNFKGVFRQESFADTARRCYAEVPGTRYAGMYQFTTPILIIRDPELIKQVTVKDFDHFVDHRSIVPEEDPLLGKNLPTLKGQKWREMRHVLTPAFTSSKMRGIFALMMETAQNFSTHFLNKNEDTVELEIKDAFTRYTNDVIATTAFGIKTDSLNEPTNEFYMMGKEATDFTSFRKILKFFGFLFIPKLFSLLKVQFFDETVSSFFINLIGENVKTRKEKGIIRPDVLQLLIEAQRKRENEEINNIDNSGKPSGREITMVDIAAQAMIFFFAGFDAVATAISFLAYELAANPDIQQKLREEIKETLEECKGNLTYEALLKMKYMDMVVSGYTYVPVVEQSRLQEHVVLKKLKKYKLLLYLRTKGYEYVYHFKESLRKWPNAVGTDRVCTKPYTILPVKPDERPVNIEKGHIIFISIFGIHRDPEIYPEPDCFDPERFSDENKGSINLDAYLPFGIGPRNCIGNRFALMEMKAVIFSLLNNFEIVPTAKTKIPLVLSKTQMNLHPEGGFNLGLKRLKK